MASKREAPSLINIFLTVLILDNLSLETVAAERSIGYIGGESWCFYKAHFAHSPITAGCDIGGKHSGATAGIFAIPAPKKKTNVAVIKYVAIMIELLILMS
jgi:hypothetical protein